MSVVVDTGFLLAAYDTANEHHDVAAEWARINDDDLVTTPLAVAEMDELVLDHKPLLADLERGALTVRWWADALDETIRIARRHPHLTLTDASLVALAQRQRTDRIATFDSHFRSIRLPKGKHLRVLPDDDPKDPDS